MARTNHSRNTVGRPGVLIALAVSLVLTMLISATPAPAAPPAAPTINEPAEGRNPHPADVHMEATGFSDTDGDTHQCTRWEIWAVDPEQRAWSSPCVGSELKVHIHLGDGTFEGPQAGKTELEYSTPYELRVRFEDSNGELGAEAVRPFTTTHAGPPGQAGADPWATRQPGYRVDVIASGFQLPLAVAMVPNPGNDPSDPMAYVAELYGSIQTVTNDGEVHEYAHGLLNFDPTGPFPGTGEQGVGGLAVDPQSGDLFASMMYEDISSPEDPNPLYPKVVRLHSTDGGLTSSSQETILDMHGAFQGHSHQVSNVTVGPDGHVYVHNGDGFYFYDAPTDLDDWRGKVLRMTKDGDPVTSNPFYGAADAGSDGLLDPRDYVFAYGFRNAFGGTWRASDGKHYQVENGPFIDRFARVDRGVNYKWDGTDASMATGALYNWSPAHAPLQISFIEPQTFGGSGFPQTKMDHAYVTETGPTYATGPTELGKRIVDFAPEGSGFADPRALIEYTGVGKATAAGLAAGPDGLYFTDLYPDGTATAPFDLGAKLLRVRYVGAGPPETTIAKGPRKEVRTKRKRKAFSFTLMASRDDASFECKRDKREFEPCNSAYRPVVRAKRNHFKEHKLLVRATDDAGTDPTPAKYKWRLKRKR